MAFPGPSLGPLNVIIVDADAGERRTLARLIAARTDGRFCAAAYASTAEAFAATNGRANAIMIADLETIGGTNRLADIAEAAMPLIATSANGSLTTAIAAIKGGAIDFLPKPIGARALIDRLEAAVDSWPSTSRPTVNVERTLAKTDFAGFIGRSPPMQAVYDQIRLIAPSRAPVFITGESGTGKELCAEAIHQFAAAEERPFVAINCSAIPRDLMESEIFGHVRGAFTGAGDNRIGAAERANGGTLFLDEIAEMDHALQAKLLRFLQSGTIQRVGGSELKPVDARIVCATNRDPFAEVAAGRFRSDLFYRLHVLPVHLPPLRERGDDVRLLAQAFLDRFATEEGRRFRGFDDVVADRLVAYPWPGNVRELANLIRRIVVLGDGTTVDQLMLPTALMGRDHAGDNGGDAGERTPLGVGPLWQQERQIIEATLAAFGGNISRAAAALEISPSTIYRKRQSWSQRRRQPA